MLEVESEYAEKSFRENLTNSGLLTGNNKFIFSKTNIYFWRKKSRKKLLSWTRLARGEGGIEPCAYMQIHKCRLGRCIQVVVVVRAYQSRQSLEKHQHHLTERWLDTTSVVDPEWFISDPDPALNFPRSGSNQCYLSICGNCKKKLKFNHKELFTIHLSRIHREITFLFICSFISCWINADPDPQHWIQQP